ncbi:hypothetical protein D9757_003033 [Collybiopsis confluens]|uniref:Uncharacterized protein n=1 Tax=Collybiopsis confluens TaxID=2823264 RepID=A0A8H5HX86_9AGAR|nr:hypothetical protein D9757_003033 [Collybiopsis confluens]
MIRSHSDSTTASTSSPTPVSPFSSDHSVPSEPTSDETPDLGAFNAVLRAWNNLQPPRILNPTFMQQTQTSSSITTTSSSEILERKSTVWSHKPIANYLTLSETIPSESESTDRDQPRAVPIQSEDSDDLGHLDEDNPYDDNDDSDELQLQLPVQEFSLLDIDEQPSLGYLDEALKFIAAERKRWTAQREADANAAMLAGIEPRRKRRRKRNRTTPRAHSTTRTPTVSSFSTATATSTATASSSTLGDNFDDPGNSADFLGAEADDSSSSIDQQTSPLREPRSSVLFRSAPGTPARRGRARGRARLQHSRSTPQLRTYNRDEEDEEESTTDPVNEESPRLKQMRILGKRLKALFPEDKHYLQRVQFHSMSPQAAIGYQLGSTGHLDSIDPESTSRNVVLGEFVDTRGTKNTGKSDERLIHVFVDHSNILIGLLNYLRRYPGRHPQYRASSYNAQPKPPKHLSHSALTLILERGRPVARRILVASSPLYQPLESAERLGFEVRVFARVPDTGDGMDRERSNAYGNGSRPGHKRSQSSGSSFNGNNGATGHLASLVGDSSSPQNQRRQRKRAGSVNNNINGGSNGFDGSSNGSLTVSGRRKGHSRKPSDNTSAESEQNGGSSSLSLQGYSQGFSRVPGGSIPHGHHAYSHSLPSSHMSTPPILAPAAVISLGAAPQPPQQQQQRIRYREQGVDELLQLKLHQVLASIDGPPPKNSTIILATGDGNVGQFNEDGFLGGVRTALRRGWNVELYAWEGGLSRAWKREFGEGSEWAGSGSKSTFRVIGMEQFGSELVEIYY